MPERPGQIYPKQPRDPAPPKPPATLAETQRANCWLRAYCQNYHCRRGQPITLAWAVIRWGPDTSSKVLRRNLVCSKCGHRGATLYHPSWDMVRDAWEEFPVAKAEPISVAVPDQSPRDPVVLRRPWIGR